MNDGRTFREKKNYHFFMNQTNFLKDFENKRFFGTIFFNKCSYFYRMNDFLMYERLY